MKEKSPIAVLPVHSPSRTLGQAPGAVKESEADDPMYLDGTFVPEGEPDRMAEAMVEEFAHLGMDENQIFSLFARPFYAGTHRYFRLRGENETRQLIRSVLDRTGTLRMNVEHLCGEH